jgi:hypothetical protein
LVADAFIFVFLFLKKAKTKAIHAWLVVGRQVVDAGEGAGGGVHDISPAARSTPAAIKEGNLGQSEKGDLAVTSRACGVS